MDANQGKCGLVGFGFGFGFGLDLVLDLLCFEQRVHISVLLVLENKQVLD